MKLKDMLPEGAENMGAEDFLSNIQNNWLFAMMDPIADYYNERLSMAALLAEHGIELSGDKEQQVNCTFPEHGTQDNHKSARYYSFDRNTDRKSERLYCFKCEKRRTTLWYLVAQLKAQEDKSFRDVLIYIEKRYRIPFPRHLLLEFDLDAFYQFGGNNQQARHITLFASAKDLRRYKDNDDIFISGIQTLLGQQNGQQPATTRPTTTPVAPVTTDSEIDFASLPSGPVFGAGNSGTPEPEFFEE